jgi:hypothetical protein
MAHVRFSVGIDPSLFAEIETNIDGKTRNAKVLTCITAGYEKLTEKHTPCKVKPHPKAEGTAAQP